MRREYDYQYTSEDVEALRRCSTDLRATVYSFGLGGAAFWGSGRALQALTRSLK